ncbi:MAG: hypothetical protein WBQ34_18865 [Candidatus Acidiferrales bacterium]
MTEPEKFETEEKSRFPVAFLAGLAVVSVIVIIFLVATRSSKPPKLSPEPKLPFSADAQSYAGNIHFQNLELSESSNMLNEKFTYLDGIISNKGTRTIEALEVLVEFHDPFNQVVLRETHRVISAASQPLGPGKQRSFDLTFEQLPAEWNQQYPTIRVTGLVLQ